MLTSVNDILQEAGQQKEYVTISQNNDVLSRFSDLNAKLLALNKIVGEKSNSDSLIKNL
jgi:hypothetical protein